MSRGGKALEDPFRGRHIVPGGRSRIARDPELRAELDAMARQPITLKEMRRRLVAVFGERRVPPRSSLARYVRRRRLALGYRPDGLRVALAPE